MALASAKYRPLCEGAAKFYQLPEWNGITGAAWLEAMIMQESGANPRARRYEPHQDRRGRADAAQDADRPEIDDGPLEDDASYGLFQVMGYNYRRLIGADPGVRLSFAPLYRPHLNLSMGLAILLGELAATMNDVTRALCRYNGGPSGDQLLPDNTGHMGYRRQVYADGVRRWALRVMDDRGDVR